MTVLRAMFSAIGASVLWLSAAQATTLINRDGSVHNLRIVEGAQERTIKAEPLQQFDDLCASSCRLYFDDDPEAYEIAAGDIVSIEDGQLFFEDPDTRQSPAGEAGAETPEKQ